MLLSSKLTPTTSNLLVSSIPPGYGPSRISWLRACRSKSISHLGSSSDIHLFAYRISSISCSSLNCRCDKPPIPCRPASCGKSLPSPASRDEYWLYKKYPVPQRTLKKAIINRIFRVLPSLFIAPPSFIQQFSKFYLEDKLYFSGDPLFFDQFVQGIQAFLVMLRVYSSQPLCIFQCRAGLTGETIEYHDAVMDHRRNLLQPKFLFDPYRLQVPGKGFFHELFIIPSTLFTEDKTQIVAVKTLELLGDRLLEV